MDAACFDLGGEDRLVLSLEWCVEAGHLVENAAEGPDISPLIVSLG